MTAPGRDTIISFLKQHVSPERLQHTLGALDVALSLAEKHGCDKNKTETAVLLHDAGKGFSLKAMARYAAKQRLKIPDIGEIIRHNPGLLHSYISADIARRAFGVRDREILAAIASHTFGGVTMSLLAKIVYVADAIAPDRDYPGVEKIRWHSRRSIDAAFRLAVQIKLLHIINEGRWFAPESLRTWNAWCAPADGTK